VKTLYFDCFSGISGDMTIAALLDLGVPYRYLETELRELGLSKEYHLHVGKGKQQEITGVKFDVHSHHEHERHHLLSPTHEHSHKPISVDEVADLVPTSARSATGKRNFTLRQEHIHGRTYADIRKLIQKSKLSALVKKRSLNIFHRIAVVEGKIHGMPTDKVHFHEVGAIDSIVDIVGVCILIEKLAPQQILASIPCEGHGFVNCAHGRFPVPTTATLELLKGISLRQIDIPSELITPTGAGILAEFVEHFTPLPVFKTEKIGYGLGTKVFPNHPNVLRVLLGEAERFQPQDGSAVDVIETNLDDTTPEIIAHSIDQLLRKGAREAFSRSIQMKKGRLGTMITVLCDPQKTEQLSKLLMKETGTFGVRVRRSERICLSREIKTVKTKWGPIQIKIGSLDGETISAKPEFEICRKLAEKRKVPVRIVWAVALAECAKLQV
jgi:pyridinium-3,5-bisthiocarboxylic acid mononucleotide nickel chelatase